MCPTILSVSAHFPPGLCKGLLELPASSPHTAPPSPLANHLPAVPEISESQIHCKSLCCSPYSFQDQVQILQLSTWHSEGSGPCLPSPNSPPHTEIWPLVSCQFIPLGLCTCSSQSGVPCPSLFIRPVPCIPQVSAQESSWISTDCFSSSILESYPEHVEIIMTLSVCSPTKHRCHLEAGG